MTGGVHRHLQAGLTSQSTAWSPSLSTPSSPSSPAGVSQGPGVALAAVRGAVDPVALPRDAAGALDARRRFGTSSALGLASDAASDAPWESTASRAAVRAGTSHGGGKSGRWMRLRGSPASGVEASSGCGGKDDRPLARPPRPCRGLRGTGGGLTAASWAVGWTSSGSGVFSADGGSGWATSAPARPAAASSLGVGGSDTGKGFATAGAAIGGRSAHQSSSQSEAMPRSPPRLSMPTTKNTLCSVGRAAACAPFRSPAISVEVVSAVPGGVETTT